MGHSDSMTADDATKAKGAELLRLHQDETLLTLVNVWDVVSAKVVAAAEGTTALATASHSIAASFGYEDGENIPLDLMLEQVGRIVDVDRPAGDRRPRGRLRRRRRRPSAGRSGWASSAPTSRTS